MGVAWWIQKVLLMIAIIRHHRWYPLTACYGGNIAANKFFSSNLGNRTFANTFCFASGSFLKCSNWAFGSTFPGNAHNCIKNQDRKDLGHISAGLPKAPAENMENGWLTTTKSPTAVKAGPHSRKANTNDTGVEACNIVIWSLNCFTRSCYNRIRGFSRSADSRLMLA